MTIQYKDCNYIISQRSVYISCTDWHISLRPQAVTKMTITKRHERVCHLSQLHEAYKLEVPKHQVIQQVTTGANMQLLHMCESH